MANYSVTTTLYLGSLAEVTAAMETAIEAKDTAKVIRLCSVLPAYGDKYRGVLIVDT